MKNTIFKSFKFTFSVSVGIATPLMSDPLFNSAHKPFNIYKHTPDLL